LIKPQKIRKRGKELLTKWKLRELKLQSQKRKRKKKKKKKEETTEEDAE